MSKELLFIQYPKCGTCRNAKKWLDKNDFKYMDRDISKNNPTKEELDKWITKSGLDIMKFFNTSGRIYRENKLKDIVKTASRDKLLEMLASDGMLVKRPILVSKDEVIIGFKDEEWNEALK